MGANERQSKANAEIKLLGNCRLIILPFILFSHYVTFISDALHQKSLDVARRSHHEIWSVIAYRSQRHNFGLLRWVDWRPEISSRHGWLCGQREFSFVSAECDDAVQAGV